MRERHSPTAERDKPLSGAAKRNANGAGRPGAGKRAMRHTHRPRGAALAEGTDYCVLETLVGFWVRRAEVKVLRSFALHLAAYEITPTEVAALILIGANRGLSQTALAGALGTDQSTVVNLLSGLERRCLISRIRDAQDRRYHVLSLTPEGRNAARRIKSALARHTRALQQGLTELEKDSLMASLRRFVET
jgi:DNA-binding MarR family transcriptional regulator